MLSCHECGTHIAYRDDGIGTDLGLVCSIECRDALWAAATARPPVVAHTEARLATLAAAATARPWDWSPGPSWGENWLYAGDVVVARASSAEDNESIDIGAEDAAFIVALVNSWPAIETMLARLETAEAAIATSLAHSGCNLSDRAVALCVELNESCSCAPLLALRDHP